MLQAIAVTVGLALLLWSTGLPTALRHAQAASITSASDTLSNSAPGAASDHTLEFTLPNGASASSSMNVTFDGAFDMGFVVESDIDILVNGSASSTAATNGAGTWGVVVDGNVLRLVTADDSAIASSSEITIRIGANAVGGTNQITNPSATSSYPITIDGGNSNPIQDSGEVRVAIIDEVLVSAAVDTSLTFTVSGVTAGATVNGSPTTTTAATSPTTIPFGTLPIGVSQMAAQDLTVETNASNGYVVTVQTTGPFQSSTGGDIDGYADGSDTNTPGAWSAPSGLISDENTYGHWAVTSTDHATTSRSSEFSDDTWIAPSTTPRIVMGHAGPAGRTLSGIGTSTIGYQVEITALQEAGDDYEATLRYVATPTF